MHAAYLGLLILVPALAAFRVLLAPVRDVRGLALCMAAVVVNWAVNTSFVLLTGNTDPEMFFLLTDSISIAVVIYAGGGFSGALASTYIGQILAHSLRWSGSIDPDYYWQLLTALGYVQLLILAAWAIAPAYRDAGHGVE